MLRLSIDNILIHNMYNASVINAWSKVGWRIWKEAILVKSQGSRCFMYIIYNILYIIFSVVILALFSLVLKE